MYQDVENCLCLVLQESASAKCREKADENSIGSQIRLPGRLTGLTSVRRITPLIDKELIVGRAATASIMIPSPAISRVHAKITRFNNGLYEITDESSGNGVYLNGVKLAPKQPHSLVVHDEISLCPPNALCATFKVEPFDDGHRAAGILKRELSQSSIPETAAKRLRGDTDVVPERAELELSQPTSSPSSAPFSEVTDNDAPSTSGAGVKKEAVRDDLFQDMSDDLMCSICSELYIKATELNCDHVFCETCINEWRRKRQDCPMCRETITTTKVHKVLNNLVSHLVDRMTEEEKRDRAEVEEQRLKAKCPTPPPNIPPRSNGRLDGRIVQLQQFHHRVSSGSDNSPVILHEIAAPVVRTVRTDGSTVTYDMARQGHGRYHLAVPHHHPAPPARMAPVQPQSEITPYGWRVVGDRFPNPLTQMRSTATVTPAPHLAPQAAPGPARVARYVPQVGGALPNSFSQQLVSSTQLLQHRPGPFTATWHHRAQQNTFFLPAPSTTTAPTAGPFESAASTSGGAGRLFVNSPLPIVVPTTSTAPTALMSHQPPQLQARSAIDLSRDAIDISSDSDDSSNYSNDSSPSDSFESYNYQSDD